MLPRQPPSEFAPSAPDLEAQHAAPLASTSSRAALLPITNTMDGSPGDESLYRDMLRKAKGDQQLVAKWMAEIGVSTPAASQSPPPSTSQPAGKDLDAAASAVGAPETFFCPISFKVFRDPVMLPTGQTYERRYIERWLDQGNMRCPATGLLLTRPVTMTPNVALRKSIEEWAERHAVWMLGTDGHLKPIPPEDDFAVPPARAPAAVPDSDLALAIRLQEEEMARLRRGGARSAPAGHVPGMRGGGAPPAPRHHHNRQYLASSPFSILNLVLYAITAAYIALFLVSFWKNSWSFENVNVNPMVGPGAAALRNTGIRDTAAIVYHNQWWRIFSSLFLPSGVIELFAILTSVWTFAKYLERVFVAPTLTVPLVFLVSGVAGALVSTIFAQAYNTVGSTAGVCGLLGSVWADQVVNWPIYTNHIATFAVLVLVTAVFLLIGLMPFLDNFFHLGSLITGFLLAAVVIHRKRVGGRQRGHRVLQTVVRVVCGFLVALILALAIVDLVVDDGQVGKDCSWCDNVTCVGTRWWQCGATPAVEGAPNCNVTPYNNGTALVDCPSGRSAAIAVTGTPDTAGIATICRNVCQPVLAPPPGTASSGSLSPSPGLTGSPGSTGSPGNPTTAPIGDGGLI